MTDQTEERVAISVTRFATMMDVCTRTAWNWVANGLVPTVTIGGTRLIPLAAIEDLLKPPPAEAGRVLTKRGALAKKRIAERTAKRRAVEVAANLQAEAAN